MSQQWGVLQASRTLWRNGLVRHTSSWMVAADHTLSFDGTRYRIRNCLSGLWITLWKLLALRKTDLFYPPVKQENDRHMLK